MPFLRFYSCTAPRAGKIVMCVCVRREKAKPRLRSEFSSSSFVNLQPLHLNCRGQSVRLLVASCFISAGTSMNGQTFVLSSSLSCAAPPPPRSRVFYYFLSEAAAAAAATQRKAIAAVLPCARVAYFYGRRNETLNKWGERSFLSCQQSNLQQ